MAFGRPSPREQQRAEKWQLWASRRNLCAIAALVLGIFSFIEFGANLIFGIAGIALGVIALRQLARVAGQSEGRTLGHRLAWAGIILSVVSLIVAGLLYFRVVA